jgi:hypothetical protein
MQTSTAAITTLMMDAASTSEMLVNLHQITYMALQPRRQPFSSISHKSVSSHQITYFLQDTLKQLPFSYFKKLKSSVIKSKLTNILNTCVVPAKTLFSNVCTIYMLKTAAPKLNSHKHSCSLGKTEAFKH